MLELPPKNDRLIRALLRQPVDKTPVWLMRQAGRYLPEYNALRTQAGSFLNLCQTPELACEATLQPLRRFALDAAIVFADILTIADALGLGLQFIAGEGPQLQKPLRTVNDLKALPRGLNEILGRLTYVSETIRLVRQALQDRLPIIGFAGSPWTLATYVIEGGASQLFHTAKRLILNEPAFVHELLVLLTQVVAGYLNAQIKAGARAVMLFDTWGGILTPAHYQQFSLTYMQAVIAQLIRDYHGQRIPAIIFTKNGGQWLEAIAQTGCDAISLDWMTELGQARQRVGHQVALQGNLDPAVLVANPAIIRNEVQAVLTSYGAGPGHVFNLGHGIFPEAPLEHVSVLVDAVHELSASYHAASPVNI